MKDRFIIQENTSRPGWLLCADKEHNIVCHFEEHRFNETQNIELLNGEQFNSSEDAVKYATYVREMGDWLAANHADKIF